MIFIIALNVTEVELLWINIWEFETVILWMLSLAVLLCDS